MLNSASAVQHKHSANSLSLSGSSSSSSIDHLNPAVDEPLLQQQHLNLKTYLIEKLLNEQDDLKPIKVEPLMNKKSVSKEDLVSEAGTYTIEENNSNIVGMNIESSVEKHEQNHMLNSIDLMSARAAIDEKFGISSSNTDSLINDDMTSSKVTVLDHKRQMQKIARERNMTYSLTHDLGVHLNQRINDQNSDICVESVGNSLTKATTYDVIAHSEDISVETLTNGDNISHSMDLDNTVISQVSSTKSGVDTELLLGNTEQLIETIKKRRSEKKLLLQKRLDNANNCIKNSSKHTISPSSSSCSSSTTMSMEKDLRSWTIPSNNSQDELQTTRATVNSRNGKKNPIKNSNNSSYSEDEKQSNASGDSHLHSQRRGNGGLAFDYILSDEKSSIGSVNSRPSQQQMLTKANVQRHRSATRNTNLSFNTQQKTNSQSSNKTASSTSRAPSSRSNHQSITRNLDHNKVRKQSEDIESNVTNLTEFATPKSSISLGARIAAKANENNSDDGTPRTPARRRASDNCAQPSVTSSVNSSTSNANNSFASPYTNRTLFLRQQSALAKRESLNSDSKKMSVPLNGILKKPTTAANFRNGQRASSKQPSRGTSRNTSPYSHGVPSHQSPLMTGSLNLPYGASLSSVSVNPYTDQRGSFQRRKNYDPIKAVEMEKQNKQLQQNRSVTNQNKQATGTYSRIQTSDSHHSICSTENERCQSYDYDPMFDSSYSIPVQNLKANINNKNIPNNIVRKIKGRSLSVTPKSTVILPNISDWSRPAIYSYSDAAKAGLMIKKEYSAPIDRNLNPPMKLPNFTKKEYSAPIDRTKSPLVSENNSKKDDGSIKEINLDKKSESEMMFENLESNTEKLKSYEKILQSTLQRLCIRLIQMSTGVLDKIGDENSSTETNLFSSTESTELERMQKLAKLVHSMQLVHDHIQIIDTSLFNHRPNEEAYMKELNKIRQEVENLKQNASANNSVLSNASNSY